jgi:hypothetical protein
MNRMAQSAKFRQVANAAASFLVEISQYAWDNEEG